MEQPKFQLQMTATMNLEKREESLYRWDMDFVSV